MYPMQCKKKMKAKNKYIKQLMLQFKMFVKEFLSRTRHLFCFIYITYLFIFIALL